MINLLPPSYKKDILQEKKLALVLTLEFIPFIFLISLVLILFSIEIYTKSQGEAIKIMRAQEEKISEDLGILNFKKKIGSTSQKILSLESFYKNRVNSLEVLEKVFSTLPPEVSLSNLLWQKDAARINLSGFAPSREILFKLKNNLEGEKEFTEISFPPSNWVKPVEIDFQISFKIVR